MKKIKQFFKSFLFISIWLIISAYLTRYWNTFHWKYIYLNLEQLFYEKFWFLLERNPFELDLDHWLEKMLNFLSYEIPKEIFKYLPIYYFLKSTWKKK